MTNIQLNLAPDLPLPHVPILSDLWGKCPNLTGAMDLGEVSQLSPEGQSFEVSMEGENDNQLLMEYIFCETQKSFMDMICFKTKILVLYCFSLKPPYQKWMFFFGEMIILAKLIAT